MNQPSPKLLQYLLSSLFGCALCIACHAQRPVYELYDLREDPAEVNNLAAAMPDKVQELVAAHGTLNPLLSFFLFLFELPRLK